MMLNKFFDRIPYLKTLSAAQLQFVSFLAVGALNTLVGYALYAVFILCGFTVAYALGGATALGVVFNYFSTGKLVFRNTGLQKLLLFIAAYIVIYLVNLVLIKLLQSIGLGPLAAQAILLAPIAVLSFILMKHSVFKTK